MYLPFFSRDMSDDPGSTNKRSLTSATREAEVNRRYVHLTCTVKRTMNNHGALTLSAASGRRTFQVVDYATEDIRLALAHAVGGTTVDVHLVALGSRGDAWRVSAVASGTQRPDNHRVLATD